MTTEAITTPDESVKPPEAEPPTTELLSGAVGDRCANCQAPLASDQRYCINCGERRGVPRFTPANAAAQAAPAGGGVEAPPPYRSRFSSGSTLVAGVATLLLAMGVGVLIGHDTNSSPARAGAPEVITVPSGGTASSTTTGAASTSSGGSTTASSAAAHNAAKKGKVPTIRLTGKGSQAASKAASQAIGSGAPKNPTVQQGQSCTAGTAGCQNGHFTGNFFGGG